MTKARRDGVPTGRGVTYERDADDGGTALAGGAVSAARLLCRLGTPSLRLPKRTKPEAILVHKSE